jgi:hypothetical protein
MPPMSCVAHWIRCVVFVSVPIVSCGGEVALNGLAPADAGGSEDATYDAHVSETPALDASADAPTSVAPTETPPPNATTEAPPETGGDDAAAPGTQCGPSNCTGCCDSAGSCQLGDQSDNCGSGGGACYPCFSPSTLCRQGSCWIPISFVVPCPSNCGGCCDAHGNCFGGQSATACGSGGTGCVNCSAGEVCTNGSCQPDFDGGPCVASICPACIPNLQPGCCRADQTCGCGPRLGTASDGGTCT